ncbi:ATP-dependent helicase/deoxyribonuclease subunit B [bioreactor metagenome]|uniref:ATP-dependent helicase/deoxyribonuclease subunit B n=1 Tax=bioreactor metagenome TaxID=1076179 RepID=A0A645I9K1_9ZZZZ
MLVRERVGFPETSLRYLVTGKVLVHGLQDSFFIRTPRRSDQTSFWPIPRQAVDHLMEEALSQQKNPVLASSRRYQHMTGKLKHIIASSVDVIQNQIIRGEFEPLYSEVGFGPNEMIPPIVLDL